MMPSRRSFARLTARWLADALFDELRPRLDAWLDSRLEARVQPGVPPEVQARLTALQEEQARLEKKLGMAMGAVQASTAQLSSIRQELGPLAQRAQAGVAAQATAESAVDGLAALEDRIKALEQAPRSTRAPRKAEPKP